MSAETEVDELLASWDERLKRIDENLIALESEPTYEILTSVRGQKAVLEGVTRERVEPALSALAELFEHRARLTEIVERAKEIRARASFWDKDQRLHEGKEILYGPSIKMASPPTPLAQRNLLDPVGNDVAVVPERLLEAMAQVFTAARDAVTAVARAWARLEPVLEGAEGELSSLQAIAGEVGLTSEVAPEIDWLTRETARVRALVSKDPLGVSGGIDAALLPRLAELRRRLRELKGKKDRVEQGLRDAVQHEREARDAHRRAREALGRAGLELSGAAFPSMVDDAMLNGLVPWRERIAETARAGRFGPADVGLTRWTETVRAYAAQDEAVVANVEAAFRERAELIGRLSARRAQIDVMAARGVELPPGLAERARAIEALLSARPTPVRDAAKSLEAFEAEVVALAARARRG
jgi:hypothetical protein